MKDRPNRCECGSEDVVFVEDCGPWHVECLACNRHTGPFWERGSALEAWNAGRVKVPGPVRTDAGDYNYGGWQGASEARRIYGRA